MNADGYRALYGYHFALNRRLWDRSVMALTDEQFKRKTRYSVGSVRNQMVHVLNIDERWFCGLRGVKVPGLLNPVYVPNRPRVRAKWDQVEADMRAYLEGLTDDALDQPVADVPMRVWEVLFHVLNHGTDHRAQTLALLAELGAPTFPQDYALYVFAGRPAAGR